MTSDEYPFPVAVAELGEDDSREAQSARAIAWLIEQPGGPITVITPTRSFDNEPLNRLIARPDTSHHTWREISTGPLGSRRVLYAWPDRQHLNSLWGIQAEALVVIEWGATETAEWAVDAQAVRLLPGHELPPLTRVAAARDAPDAPLPDNVVRILESLARWAAGYDSGLKWNEEDKLKADMMNRPERWTTVNADQVRDKCRELRMRPDDVDTIVGYLERRQQGRRFNVRSTYRDFHF